jgi:hypothetical protein
MAFHKLDPESAKQNDNRQSGINKSAAYTGVLTKAEFSENKQKGSSGINFSFKTSSGQEANWHTNLNYFKDGETQDNDGGWQQLDALMVCLKVKELEDPQMLPMERWENGGKVQSQGYQFAQLLNRKLGVAFRMEEYYNKDGELKERPTVFTFFEPSTNLVAGEILDRVTDPKRLDAALEYLASNPVKKAKIKIHVEHAAPVRRTQEERFERAAQPIDDIDDSIPF